MIKPLLSRTHQRLAWVLLVLGALGFFAWLARPRFGERVLMLSSPLESRGRDLGPGLETLLRDHLEILAGATVEHQDQLPEPDELRRMPQGTWLFRFQGRREGDQIVLTTEWTTVGRLLHGKPWTWDSPPSQEPRAAMARLVGRWPLAVRFPSGEDLLPKDQARFWPLLEALSIQDDQVATEQLPTTQRLAEAEPQCATVWTLLGDHLYRSLWVQPDAAGVGLNSRTHRAFQQALTLVPGHPRATFLDSLLLTDTGNQQLALQTLQTALRLRPGMPDLYLGLAYAGRTCGLLQGARRALDLRRTLLRASSEPSTWLVETTYLYQGDLAAFRENLQGVRADRVEASVLFYRGYLALLQGHREQALSHFQLGSAPTRSPAPFRELCRAYQAYLEGRSAQGLAELRALDEWRGKLRIPDGEWTFKEAEAYALLGDTDRALDAATRAFVQGFSCAAWFEGSPFLARARSHPRWATLRRNVRERQAMLEGSFPAQSFLP